MNPLAFPSDHPAPTAPGPCVTRPELFDSPYVEDHQIAKEYCLRCPNLGWCADQLRQHYAEARKLQTDPTMPRLGLPQGTYAGTLVGARGPKAKARCGTNSGYYKHLRATPKQDPCGPCRAAHAAYQNEQNSRNRDAANASRRDRRRAATTARREAEAS